MAWSVSADVEEYDEAIEAFRRRVPITRELAARVNGFTHARGFTISGVAQLDVVQDVHASILEGIRKGTPLEEWKKQIEATLTAAWGRKNSPRLETIFRNATMQAYNAGRRRQMLEPSVVRFRPFWMFDGIADSRQTEICKACDGTILPHNHPWWNTHTPQLHHRCRSSVRNMRASDAQRRGVTVSPPTEQADEGFGAPPETGEPWKPDLSKYSAPLATTYLQKQQELRAAPAKTLEPTAALRLKGNEFASALDLKDGGRDARNILREQIQESFPGAIPRNLDGAHLLDAKTPLSDPGLAQSNGYYELSGSVRPGRMVIHRGRVARAKLAAEKLAAGRLNDSGDANLIDALRTLLHEEMHGHSRGNSRTVESNVALVLEEVGTELSARKVLGDLLPTLTQARLKKLRIGSYQPYIDATVDVVRQATGETLDQATERVVAAHSRSSLTRMGHWTSADEPLEAFLDGLDVTTDQAQAIKAGLLEAF